MLKHRLARCVNLVLINLTLIETRVRNAPRVNLLQILVAPLALIAKKAKSQVRARLLVRRVKEASMQLAWATQFVLIALKDTMQSREVWAAASHVQPAATKMTLESHCAWSASPELIRRLKANRIASNASEVATPLTSVLRNVSIAQQDQSQIATVPLVASHAHSVVFNPWQASLHVSTAYQVNTRQSKEV